MAYEHLEILRLNVEQAIATLGAGLMQVHFSKIFTEAQLFQMRGSPMVGKKSRCEVVVGLDLCCLSDTPWWVRRTLQDVVNSSSRGFTLHGREVKVAQSVDRDVGSIDAAEGTTMTPTPEGSHVVDTGSSLARRFLAASCPLCLLHGLEIR
ncbi:hypothetical protein PIB30_000714 [Stylosanthes scabra]|uniref:Uncharacterized protein n=1 Tax=Stylosanthes scabra TaxID=79078 RepID=A0ABU6Z4J0_9FABA|nr:hypothetical protein [Stylosanthes scabra]